MNSSCYDNQIFIKTDTNISERILSEYSHVGSFLFKRFNAFVLIYYRIEFINPSECSDIIPFYLSIHIYNLILHTVKWDNTWC